MVEPVSPLLHVYVMEPIPSSSSRLFDAVRTWSSAAVPEMVTVPVVASLTFTTAAVPALVRDSAVVWPSV